MKKISSLVASISALVIMLTGCNNTPSVSTPPTADDQTLQIVTSIPPLYSYTSYLTEGTSANVINIVPPNVSVHAFSLTPTVRKTLAEADLIVINGQELEHFLEDILIEYQDKVVDTSKNVELLAFEDNHAEHEDEHHEDEHHEDEHHEDEHHEDEDHENEHHEDEHHHGEFDPHIWLDPKNAVVQTQTIYEALVKAQPESQSTYQQNLENFTKEITALDTHIRSTIAQIDIKPYIVFHNAYSYFEKAYGIKATASFEEFPGKEPSAAYLAELIETIETEDIGVIFTEPQFSPKLVTTISSDYNLRVGTLDPLGTQLSSDGYFALMNKNLEALKTAFAQ